MNYLTIGVPAETAQVTTGLVHFSNDDSPGTYVSQDDGYTFANNLRDLVAGRPLGELQRGILQTLENLLRAPSSFATKASPPPAPADVAETSGNNPGP